jgi:hypothetical protein
MENWKKVLLRAAGFGGGFAVIGAIILGVAVWWSGRPVKPKPWNKTAITASYEAIVVTGKDNTVDVLYTLRNNTDEDYKIADDSSIHFGVTTRQFQVTNYQDKDFGKFDYPIFVPAKSQVQVVLHIGLTMVEHLKDGATDDEQHDFNTRVAQLMQAAASNVSGFVVLDDNARYEIDLPEGWSERAKMPMRVKTPDAAK